MAYFLSFFPAGRLLSLRNTREWLTARYSDDARFFFVFPLCSSRGRAVYIGAARGESYNFYAGVESLLKGNKAAVVTISLRDLRCVWTEIDDSYIFFGINSRVVFIAFSMFFFNIICNNH